MDHQLNPAPDIDFTPIDASRDPAAAINKLRELSNQIIEDGTLAEDVRADLYKSFLTFVEESFGETPIAVALNQQFSKINNLREDHHDSPHIQRAITETYAALITTDRYGTNTDRGAWQPKTPYQIGDVVTHNNMTFICRKAPAADSGVPPTVDIRCWGLSGDIHTKDHVVATAEPKEPPKPLKLPIKWCGEWHSETRYTFGCIVSHLGERYLCGIFPGEAKHTSIPSKSPREWHLWDINLQPKYEEEEDQWYAEQLRAIIEMPPLPPHSVWEKDAPYNSGDIVSFYNILFLCQRDIPMSYLPPTSNPIGWTRYSFFEIQRTEESIRQPKLNLSTGILDPSEGVCGICGGTEFLQEFVLPCWQHELDSIGNIKTIAHSVTQQPILCCTNCQAGFAESIMMLTHPQLVNQNPTP